MADRVDILFHLPPDLQDYARQENLGNSSLLNTVPGSKSTYLEAISSGQMSQEEAMRSGNIDASEFGRLDSEIPQSR